MRLVPDSATSLSLGALTFQCLELIVDRIEDERPILDIMNVMKSECDASLKTLGRNRQVG